MPNSCLSPTSGRAPRADAMAASSTVDTTEHKGGREGRSRCPRTLTYSLALRQPPEARREGIKSTNKQTAKEHSRLLSGRIYLFGAFDIVGFSALSLPPSDALLSAPVQSGCPPTERCPRAAGTVASQHKIHFRTALSIEPQLPRYLWPGLVCQLYPVGRLRGSTPRRNDKKVWLPPAAGRRYLSH